MRKNYPEIWSAFRVLYYETNSKFFKYSKTLEEVEKEMDAREDFERRQLSLF